MGKLLPMLIMLCMMGWMPYSNPTITDHRDGQEYNTMTIGNIVMMVENLYSLIQSKIYADFCSNKVFHIYSVGYFMNE